MKKFTLEEVKNQIKELNPNIELLSGSYKDCMTKMDFKCNVCGNEWETRLTDIKQGSGCPDCGMQKSIKTGKDRSYNLEKIKELAKEYKPNLIILSEIYTNKNDKALVKCSDCGYEWQMLWRKIYEKSNKKYCPCCSGKVVSDKNSIENNRSDLIKYFKNKEDVKKYSIWSHVSVDTICDICGNEKITKVMDLTRNPYSCNICGDGVSKPEKFMSSILKQLGFNYEHQKRFSWLNNRNYDFYIEELNLVVETHGGQHYYDCGFSKTLEEQQIIDEEKKSMAIKNGLNFVDINCSKSEKTYMKKNIIKSMKKYIDFSNVDFDLAYIYCNTTYTKTIADLYNEGLDFEEIKRQITLSDSLIQLYFTRAKNLNLIIKEHNSV